MPFAKTYPAASDPIRRLARCALPRLAASAPMGKYPQLALDSLLGAPHVGGDSESPPGKRLHERVANHLNLPKRFLVRGGAAPTCVKEARGPQKFPPNNSARTRVCSQTVA